jgi:hypothetical protein
VPTSFLCNFTVPDRAIFSKGLSTRDDEMKKKKNDVRIATHLLLSNNPTKDQSLCPKIRLKTKVGGGGEREDGDPTLNPTYLAFNTKYSFLN